MKEIVINSWDDIHNILFSKSWNEEIERYRSPYAFRGLSNKDYKLKNSLIRLGGNFEVLEHHLLRNFRKYASRNLVEYDSIWHWLALAQHHGLPTRLLDWTFSPYVALHFATANVDRFDKDGVIWALNYNDLHQLLPGLLKRKLKEEGANLFTVEILADSVKTLNDLSTLKQDPFIVFFESPSIDDRIVNQSALFSLMSSSSLLLDDFR